MAYCTKCGAKLDSDSSFCSECGAPISDNQGGSNSSSAGGYVGYNNSVKKSVDPFSVTSFIFGLLGFFSCCCFPGVFSAVLGLIFGIIAYKNFDEYKYDYKWLATMGIIFSLVTIVGFVLVAVFGSVNFMVDYPNIHFIG